jgi:hypothetical protein
MKSENSRYSANCTAFERCSNRPDRGEYHAMLDGAQQALGWVLQSPTELEKTIREVAKELDDADQQGGA